jgi:hypothetical protein
MQKSFNQTVYNFNLIHGVKQMIEVFYLDSQIKEKLS